MKKRIRKKLHRGEFKEMGFCVSFRVQESMTDEELDLFLDKFLSEAIEAQGMEFGGSGYKDWQGFVSLSGRGSVTEEQLNSVEAWLAAHPSVEEHKVSALVDSWYGSCE